MVVLFLIGIIIVLLHYHARLNEHSEHIKQLQQQIKRLQQQLEQAQSSRIDEHINIKSTHQAIENKNENIEIVPKPEHHLSSETTFPKANDIYHTDDVIFPNAETPHQQEQNVIFPKTETVNTSRWHSSRPSSPSLIEQVWAWFSTGNPMLKIGVAILFLGLAFLLRFASDYIDTPLWLRYLAVGLSGLVATGAGIYLAQKRREYGLILQGFGLAVMYLTTLASLKLPQLIAPSTAFVLMLMVVIGKIVLALRQDAKILAQIALIGGLATPILTSSGSNNYLGLFCYLALLNTGIAMISQFKTWRSLNAMSLLGTFAIVFLWQGRASEMMLAESRFASLAFGFYHVVLYGYMVCMYAQLQLQQTQPIPSLANQATLSQIYHHYLRFGLQVGVLDASVLFGSALAGFLFLYFTVNDWFAQASMYLSWSFAVIYAGIALFFARTLAKQDDTLSHALWLLVGCFISLGIGLGFDDALAVGLWALQACLVYVFGLKQRVPMARCFALMVLVCSSVLWFDDYQLWRIVGDHLLKANRYGTLWLVLAGALAYGLWQHWQGRQHSAEWEIKTQQIALALTLIHAMILPSLWFGILATAWLLIIGCIGLAVWLYRVANTVVAVFVPIAILWTLYYVFLNQPSTYEIKFIFLGLVSSIAILATAFSLHLPSWQNPHKKLPNVYLIAGLFALLMGFFVLYDTFNYQIEYSFDLGSRFNFTWAMLFSFAIFALIFNVIQSLTGRYWHSLAYFNLIFMPMMSLIVVNLADIYQTTAHIVLLAFVSLMLSLWILAGQRLSQIKANLVHFVHLSLVLGVASYLFSQSLNANIAYLWGVASLILWAGLVYAPFSWKTTFVQAYQQWGQLFCMLIASIWLLDVAISTPMVIGTQLPMLNAMDIIAILLAIVWYQGTKNQQLSKLKPMLMMTGAGLGLIVISSMVMRTWHFYSDIAWNFSSLVADFGVQASLSLVWSAIGISVMVIANKQLARTLWIAGASLVGVVVIKLFLIDLGNSGGVARIVSFIGVGLGLLLVGWFAPVPPKKDDDE